MPDFSDASANHPASAPDTLTFDATHDDATDRDAASPTEWAAAHATRAFNEIAALSVDIREAVGLRVTDNGGIQVAYTAGRVRYGDGAPVDVAASTVNLTDDQTNYVEVDNAGTVSANTTSFTAGQFPLATVVCASADITSVTDDRTAFWLKKDSEIDHGTIGGLTDDDHTQYLLVDGTRAMTGNLNMAAAGGLDILMQDNVAAALEIAEGANKYLTFVTTDAGEKITLGKKLEAGAVEIEGSAFDINGGNIDGTTIGGATPAAASLSSLTMSGVLSMGDNDLTDVLEVRFQASTELTIATGAVTMTQGVHRIDTESDAASDDLDTINGGNDGAVLRVRAENTARTVVLKDGTGNLELAGADITLDDTDQFTELYYDGTLSKWVLVGSGSAGSEVATWTQNHDAGGYDLLIPDNTAAAFEIMEGANSYLTFVTTDGSEKITVHKETTFNETVCFDAEFDNGNSGAADTVDWGVGNKQKSMLTGNCTYTFTAPNGPASLTLKLQQDATGSRTVTWPAAVKWPGGTAPTLSTAATAIDIVAFYYNGTDYYGQSGLNFS